MKTKTTAITILLTLTACTDATVARWGALGDPAHIVCYSGDGVVIYDGKSTGRVKSPESSDGYQFKDAKTGWLTEVSGNCVIRYGTAATKSKKPTPGTNRVLQALERDTQR